MKTSFAYERIDFANADEKYAAVVEEARRTDRVRHELSNYTATEELSGIEAEVFGIDPALMGELFWAYERYLNLIGVCDAYFGEHRDREIFDHGKYFRGECVHDIGVAVDFMVEVCGLRATQSFGWVLKVTAAQLRGGLYDHSDNDIAKG